jgi:CubicO group peptidase (beta-lactamase class C family)
MTAAFELVDPAEVGMSAARLRDADELMERQLAAGRSPMLAAVVARHGKIVFAKALGLQRPGGRALAIDDVFPLASNGKPPTAATLMALVERGRIGITDPIVAYLPELAVNDNAEVLVHHLLTHTSGWDPADVVAAMTASVTAGISEPPPGRDWLSHLFLESLWPVPRTKRAGEFMQYSNVHYTLLSEIIRRASGESLDVAMRRYVFDPIGMPDSAVIVPDELVSRVVERPDGIPHAPGHPDTVLPMYHPLWFASDDGGSGVHSTVLDYLKFLEMIRNGGVAGGTRVLSRDAIRVMTTNQVPGIAAAINGFTLSEASWSYGFSVGAATPIAGWRGGTPTRGSLRHGGAGGIASWVDLALGITAVYHEVLTEEPDDGRPPSWATNRFEDIITAAVVD